MRPTISARLALFTLFVALAPIACADDHVLAPPDGIACTRGTVAPGETVRGEVSDQSCLMYSTYSAREARAESWTLRAKANTGYVVRVRPVSGDTEFSGDIVAYTRSTRGDAMYATAGAFLIGPASRGREMLLVTDRDRILSLRVETLVYQETFGEYELEVESCPVAAMKGGAAVDALAGIDVREGCLSHGYDARHVSRVRFVTFPAAADADVRISAARTDGNGPLTMRLLGPDLDLAQSTESSIWYNAPIDQLAHSFEPVLRRAGTYTLTVGMHRDSTAIVRAELLTGSPVSLDLHTLRSDR